MRGAAVRIIPAVAVVSVAVTIPAAQVHPKAVAGGLRMAAEIAVAEMEEAEIPRARVIPAGMRAITGRPENPVRRHRQLHPIRAIKTSF